MPTSSSKRPKAPAKKSGSDTRARTKPGAAKKAAPKKKAAAARSQSGSKQPAPAVETRAAAAAAAPAEQTPPVGTEAGDASQPRSTAVPRMGKPKNPFTAGGQRPPWLDRR